MLASFWSSKKTRNKSRESKQENKTVGKGSKYLYWGSHSRSERTLKNWSRIRCSYCCCDDTRQTQKRFKNFSEIFFTSWSMVYYLKVENVRKQREQRKCERGDFISKKPRNANNTEPRGLSISSTNGYLLVLLRGWTKGPVTIGDFIFALPTCLYGYTKVYRSMERTLIVVYLWCIHTWC